MEANERFLRIATASQETLDRIDEILEGRLPAAVSEKPNYRLLSVGEACRELNMKYPTFRRAVKAGCFDVVTATGKTLIREESVREFAAGRRNPSQKSVTARRNRAACLREEYRRTHCGVV